jgi:hypothetical protein
LGFYLLLFKWVWGLGLVSYWYKQQIQGIATGLQREESISTCTEAEKAPLRIYLGRLRQVISNLIKFLRLLLSVL